MRPHWSRQSSNSLKPRNFDTLSWVSRELYWLQHAPPSAVLTRYVKEHRDHPDEVVSLIVSGREDEEDWAVLAANIVVMIAKAQEERHA